MLNPDKIKACCYCAWAEPDYDYEEGGLEHPAMFWCAVGCDCKPGYQNGCDRYTPMC